MTNGYVTNAVLAFAESFDQRVDAVADNTEDNLDAPGNQSIDDDVGCVVFGLNRGLRIFPDVGLALTRGIQSCGFPFLGHMIAK